MRTTIATVILRRSIADIIKSQARELASSIRSKAPFKAFRVRW